MLEVSREGTLDELTVRVEADLAAVDTPMLYEHAAQTLQLHIKSYIGVSALVSVGPPGAIERSQGKARRVIDKRK